MKPAATATADVALMKAENDTLRREIERLNTALLPILSDAARKRLGEYVEVMDAMSDTQLASDITVLLDSDAKRRALIKGMRP